MKNDWEGVFFIISFFQTFKSSCFLLLQSLKFSFILFLKASTLTAFHYFIFLIFQF